MKNLIWLASFPKSGNTWTRAFIGSVLGFGTIGESGDFPLFTSICSGKFLWSQAFKDQPWPEVDMSMAWRVPYQRALSQLVGNSRHFCKTHSRYGTVVGNDMFAEDVSRYAVVIVRNPFDVAASMANYLTTTPEKGAAAMSNAMLTFNNTDNNRLHRISVGGWDVNIVSWLTQQDIPMIVMRYEDIHADPVGEFGRLAREVLGITDEARIRAAIEESSFEKLKAKEQKFGFNEAVSKANPFFWKGELYHSLDIFTPRQQEIIWKVHGHVAEPLGYRFENGKIHLEPMELNRIFDLRERYEPFINANSVQA